MARGTRLLCGEGHSMILTSKKVRVKGRFQKNKVKATFFFPKTSAAVTSNPPILQTEKHPSHRSVRLCLPYISQPYLHMSVA